MIDVQSSRDDRQLRIDKVGVKDIDYPIVLRDKARGFQHTVASINMYVDLPQDFKGTHMSRFIEILNKYHGQIDNTNFIELLGELRLALDAECAHCEMSFPYFVEKRAPVSGAKSMMEYRCQYIGNLIGDDEDFIVGIHVPITTLCPCSKEMSQKGAHNQRGQVIAKVKFDKFFWIEDLIRLIEKSASSEVYALLKREDEKFVTDLAYSKPMFVEDVVREVSLKLQAEPNFTWFSVEVENFESIHNHSAYAFIEMKD